MVIQQENGAAVRVISEADGDTEEITTLNNTIEKIRAERDKYKAALEKLARLGNEPMYGNSDGNVIAQEALKGE